jgi:hypothetical protein
VTFVKQGRAGMSFARASENMTLDAKGDGPVARCYKTQQPIFVVDASSEMQMRRVQAVREFDIKGITFAPAEGGVIEYGTSALGETVDWATLEDAKVDALPRGELRKAFADGANELIFWKRVGDRYVRWSQIEPASSACCSC